MNRALKGLGSTHGATPDIHDFMRHVTPDEAKRRIDQMLASGQVSRAQVESMMGQAREIARQLGIR